MTNLNRIVTQGVISTNTAASFVGRPDDLTLDTEAGELRLHDGVTPGGSVIGGGLAFSMPPALNNDGTRANAQPLVPNVINFLQVSVDHGTSAVLPPAVAGTAVMVLAPLGTPLILVWPNGNDTINGVANDPIDGFWQSPNAVPLYFFCSVAGEWWSNGSLD